jgi:hypothetical protein
MKAHRPRIRPGPISQCDIRLPWTKPPDRVSRLRRVDPSHILARNREVDVGHEARDVLVRGRRHPERSEPARRTGTEWAGGESAYKNQILPTRLTSTYAAGGRPRRAGLGMTERLETIPPIGYERAREWISHVRGDCWCRSEHFKRHRSRLRMIASTTCSFASDAAHEFPRIRSAGLFPRRLFRRSGYPQLLLMQPTLWSRREVDDTQTSKAFS